MSLPLATGLTFGFQTRMAAPAEVTKYVGIAEKYGYSSISLGDHLAFAVPIADPLIQFAAAAVLTDKVTMIPAVYLLPLRHPSAVAKQVATLDRMCEGRLIFGVGVGGENPKEFELAGVPHKERGARVNEAIDAVRALWRDTPASFHGRFTRFEGVSIDPKPVQQPPPIWIGGRSDAALARAGRQGDGWMSYVVQADRYAQSLDKIRAAAAAAGRSMDAFTAAHLVFITVGRDYEAAKRAWVSVLSKRYAQDFEPLAKRYGVIGTPEQCVEQLERFRTAGCNYFVMSAIGDPRDERAQLETIAAEIIPRFRSR